MMTNLIYDAKNIVGESIVWDDKNGRLFWVDIVGKTIHALEPETGDHNQWTAPDFVTSIGLRKDGGAVVGLTKSICLWDIGGIFQQFAAVEPELPNNRLNEGVVGPDGAFWIGTMQNNINPDGSPKDITSSTGKLYRCTGDGRVEQVCEDTFGITNTFVWSNDHRLITADTLENSLFSYAIDPKTSTLSNRKTILSGFERGLPDGSCIDVEGYIWNCRVVGGACLIRISPNGKIDRVIDLPCSWPTSCAFGGKNLAQLFVTSARFTMEAAHLEKHSEEGGVFAVDVGVSGMPANRFG